MATDEEIFCKLIGVGKAGELNHSLYPDISIGWVLKLMAEARKEGALAEKEKWEIAVSDGLNAVPEIARKRVKLAIRKKLKEQGVEI